MTPKGGQRRCDRADIPVLRSDVEKWLDAGETRRAV
jgi:hypothetical protein